MKCHNARSASGYMLSGVLQVNFLSCLFKECFTIHTSRLRLLLPGSRRHISDGCGEQQSSDAWPPASGQGMTVTELESQLGSIGPFSLVFLLFSPTYPAILYSHATQSLPAWNPQIQSPRPLSEVGWECQCYQLQTHSSGFIDRHFQVTSDRGLRKELFNVVQI